MAKKNKVRWDDLFADNKAPSWAAQERADFLNKDKQYNAIIDTYQNEAGVEFDAATRMSMLKELRSGKPLNFAQSPEEETPAPVLPSTQKPDVRATSTGFGTTEDTSFSDTADTMGATLRDSVKGLGARLLDQVGRLPEVEKTLTKNILGGIFGVDAEQARGSFGNLASAWQQTELPTVGDAADSVRESANDPLRVARTAQLTARFDDKGGVVGFLGGGAMDALQSPSSVLSLVGGPVGAVAVADSYSAAYEQGQQNGMKGEQLEAWAMSQAAPELMSLIPAGQVIGKIPVIGPLIKKRLAAVATKELEQKIANPIIAAGVKTAMAVGGETIEEVATGSVQDLAAAAFAGQTEAEDLRRMGEAAAPKSVGEFLERRGREARAAIVTAGALSGPANQIQASRQASKDKVAQNERTINDVVEGEASEAIRLAADYQASVEKIRAEDQAVTDASNEFIGAPRQETDGFGQAQRPVEPFEQYAQRETDRIAAEQQVVTDAQNEFNKAPRAETMPGTGQAARPIEPFEAFAEREAATQQKITQRAADETEAATRLEGANKRITLDEKRKVAAAKAAETNRRDRLALQVAKDHADKTPKEQAQILADLIAVPDAKAPAAKDKPKTLEDKVQGVINQVEGLRKQKATTRVNNRIRSLYRQNPDMTAKDIAAKLAQEEGPTVEEPVAPSEVELAQKVKELSTKKGTLNIDQSVDAAGVREQEARILPVDGVPELRTPEQDKVYKDKVRSVITSMANTQENVDIRNLIKQGKVVITDRAESVGREPTKAGAQYDIADGKMFVYLDSFNTKNPKADILAALVSHEAGHAGQFNQREGRSALFKHLLGDKGNAAANKQIRELAKSGNALAIDAMNQATAAALRNTSVPNVQNLELVPYLFSSSKLNSPGRLGKVVRDVKVAARQLARKSKLGADWDFSLDELTAAADKVAGEIVKTDLKPSKQKGSADMIYPVGTKAGDKEANASRLYKSVDGRDKYVLTDEGAKLKGGASYRLLESPNTGERLTVDDMLAHDVLYDQVPSARNIPVVLDSSISGFAAYDPNPDARYISVSPRLLQGQTRTEVREALLHEIQHYVQDETGGGDQFFNEADLAGIKELDKKVQAESKKRQVKADAILDNVAALTQNATQEQKRKVSDIVRAKVDDPQKVVNLREYLTTQAVKVEGRGSQLIADFNAANRAYFDAASEKQALVNEGYFANINEREAFRTQVDSNKSQAELDARGNPEPAMRNQGKELDFPDNSGGRIDVPEGNGNIVARGLDNRMPRATRDNATHEIVDNQTKKVVDWAIGTSSALRKVDNRDNAYGGYRYQARRIREDSDPAVGKKSASLDMAAPETKAANPQFSVKERINRILSHGRQDRLDTVKIAEDLHTQMVDAIHRDMGGKVVLGANVGSTNMSDAMNKDFMEFLAHPDQSTVEGRARLIAEMSAKYPLTTKVLVEARDRISDMTMDTISDMLSTGRPLSVTQRKNIATMLANKDTYMSRAYAAFQAGRGRKWAETRWNNFAKNIGKDVEQITNPKVKADVKAVSDAIRVITKSLQIPDVDSMQDMTMDQLVSLAARHGILESQLQFDRNDPDASWLKRDELISKLEEVKDVYEDGMLEKIAMGDAKDILGLGDKDSNYAKQMSALARNPGTLKERQRVPLEIRKMLGEIELAPGAFMATMSNQAALRARAKVVSELINDPQGDIAITREQHLALPEKEQKKYTLVKSEEWGGLNGMYLRDYAYTRMEEVTGLMYSWRDAAKRMSHDVTPLTGKLVKGATGTLGALNRWTKLMAVVYNPMSWAGNFGGSFLNMVGAGNFSPTAMSEGMGTAREYVGGTFKTTTTPRLSKVIRYMNLEAADIAELQNVLGNTLEKYFDSPAAFKDSVSKLDKHGHGLAGRAHKSVIAGYAIADNWSKIANFYHRFEVLKSVYDAAGISKTEEQILQEAGDDTSYTNISPERVHSVIRTAESAGLSQYAPYFAEVLRTRVTNVALAQKDIQRGSQLRKDGHTKAANILQTHAAMRLAGQVVVNALLPAVGAFKIASHMAALGVPTALAYSIANKLSALGADDDDNEKKRRMLSEMNRVQDMVLIGVNKDGYPIYFPFSQKLDPNGPFTDLVRAFVYAETPEQLYNNLKASSLYIFPQVLKDAASAIVDDKFPESDLSRLWPQLTQTLVDAGVSANDVDRFFNVADNFIPGVARAQKTQNTTDGVAADPATQKSLERLSTLGGVRFETLDPRRVLKGYSDESNDAKATNNGVVNRSLMNTPNLTSKAVLDITEDFFRKEMERQKNDYKNVQSLRAWKFNDDQISVLLAEGGYPKKAIPDLVEGNATVAIKLKSLIEYADSSGSYQDSREYEKRNDKALVVVNKLLEMEAELNELGITIDKSQMPKGWNE